MVEDAGYTPLEALDAPEAVAILESRSDSRADLHPISRCLANGRRLDLRHARAYALAAIKIIVVSGQLKLPDLDLPPLSRFLGKPLDAVEVIAEMRDMIGHA
jgi:hypothetical protein